MTARQKLRDGQYPVSVVGESNYQMEINITCVGQKAMLLHEPANPYDEQAIAVVRAGGGTIGYLPRDHWLKRALLQEGKGANALIGEIGRANNGLLGVVLFVSLDGPPIMTRRYHRSFRR